MTLLPLSCLCVIVWAWAVCCLPAAHEHNTDTPDGVGPRFRKARSATDNMLTLREAAVPSTGASLYLCGEDFCLCDATWANCRGAFLPYIPKFPPGVTSLDFSHNEPDNTERADFFDNVTDVDWLDFSYNEDLNFSSSTFERLKHLTHFYLSYASMPCSSLSAVLTVPSLEVLKLLGVNGCEGFELLNITMPITRLQELDLSEIAMYPYVNLSYLSPFSELRRLIMSNMGVKHQQQIVMFQALHAMNLTYIDVSFSQLPCESVATLLATPSLQELNLARNGTKCKKFDFTLKDRRTNLTTLYLSSNEISEIFSFSFPISLKCLDVSRNKIKSMTFMSSLPHRQALGMSKQVLECDPLVCLPSLQQLILSDNKLDYDSLNSVSPSCLPNLTTLDLHGNRIPTFPLNKLLAKFSKFDNLEVLDLANQKTRDIIPEYYVFENCSVNARITSLNLADNNIYFHESGYVPAETFLWFPNLTILSLANNHLGSVSEERFLQFFGHLVHLQQLSLRSTGLRHIPPAMSRSFKALKSIDLRGNKLSTIPSAVLKSEHLTALDVSSNKISVVQESMFPYAIRRRLQHADFSDNPLSCSCDVLWFRSWLLASPSVFAHSSSNYLCANLPDTPITSFSMTEQACLLSRETSRFIIATVSLIFLGLSSLTFVYRYRWHIRLVLHEVFRGNGDRIRHLRQHRFQYDVFVCYDSEDLPWVRDHLVPSLEEGMGLKLCLHHRDFIPGTPIVDNIQDSVVASKKMLMLFSRQFAQSPWCQFELQLCLTHAMDTQDVLIVVLLEDIPTRELTSSMMAVMKTTTYIEWADEAEARDSFWRRMGLALHEVMPCAWV